MKTSAAGIAMLEKWEELNLIANWDTVGKCWQIGWSHTGPEVREGLVWTRAQADAAQAQDLGKAEAAVNAGISVTLPQNKFDALAIFTYNVGTGGFHGSALRDEINCGGSTAECAPLFLHFVTAGGEHSNGLVNRRNAEIALFSQAVAA